MCERCEGKAVVRSAGEGDAWWYDGGLMTMKARPADTGGSVSVIDVLVPRGKATPLHLHPEAEETFFVVDGELIVHVDGVDHRVTAGGTSTIRRGTPHAFAVASTQAHILVTFSPGGGEQYFIDAGEPALRRELPPDGKPDFERLKKAAEANGVVILGPPPFDHAGL
jgi:quercetin dioxygenase-like cupin family protein